MVENEIVKVIIKMFAINFFVFICFFKIYNKKYEYIKMVIGSIIIAIIYTIEKQYINNDMFLLIASTWLLQNIFLIGVVKEKKNVIISSFVSNTIVYIIYCVAVIIEMIIKIIFGIQFPTLDLLLINIIY